MKKDVVIYIKGKDSVGGEDEKIEFMTAGSYYEKDGAQFLSYEEINDDDHKVTKTLLKVEEERCVTLTRSGAVKSQLIIEKDRRHQCHYDNGIVDWMMGIEASNIYNDLKDNGGILNFSYSMDINAMLESEHEINIVVKECDNNEKSKS